MVPVLRIVDRTLALSGAFAPLGHLLARPIVGVSGAVLAGGALSLVVAVLVVRYAPAHDSGDAWRFGGYAFLGIVAVSLVARQGASVALVESPLLGVLAWLVVAGGALWLVERRRAETVA